MNTYQRIKRKLNLSVSYQNRLRLFNIFPNRINTRFWISNYEFKNFYETKPTYVNLKDIVGQIKEGLVPFLQVADLTNNLKPIKFHESIDEILNKKLRWNQLTQYKTMHAQLQKEVDHITVKQSMK